MYDFFGSIAKNAKETKDAKGFPKTSCIIRSLFASFASFAFFAILPEKNLASES
jgi:hypothetical protein